MIIAVFEWTTVASFELDIVYDLDSDGGDYEELFQETNQGSRLPSSLVPEQAKFADLARRIEALRRPGRTACLLRMSVTADVMGKCFNLSQAMYMTQPPTRQSRPNTVATRIEDQGWFGCDTDPDLAPVGDPLVFFRLSAGGHADLKSRLLGPDDVQPEAEADAVQPEAGEHDAQAEAGDDDV